MVVMGIDIGGTKVRCVVAALTGALMGVSQSGGANFYSSGPGAAKNLEVAVQQALVRANVAPSKVSSICVGMAGKGPETVSRVTDALSRVITMAKPNLITVRTDLEIAFKSGSATDTGVLVFAGTGAGAARFEQGECVRLHDGMGWLLGDIGSGVWLGRKVLRAVAADLDQRGESTKMTQAVMNMLGTSSTSGARARLIAEVSAMAPTEWGRFAPLAMNHDGQDKVATALVDLAADSLINGAKRMGANKVVTTVGGLLQDGPLARRLRTHFSLTYAPFPVVGACALAAESVGGAIELSDLTAQIRNQDLLQ